MMCAQPAAQRGFLLITVVLILGVLAAMALMLSTSTSLDNALVAKHAEGATLNYLAESAMEHAEWQLAQNSSCTGYMDLSNNVFGGHSYSATVTPIADSPVSIVATGALTDGTTRTLSRTNVKVYQSPATAILQPGSAGIDTYTWDGAHKGKNFGATNFISMNNQSAERTALIKFDLSSLPADVVISSATMELWVQGSDDVDDGIIDAHHVSRSWVEGEYDDQTPPAGGGATYESYDGQTNWTSPGGDYDSNVVASVTIPSQTPAWYSWDITESATSWHAGSVANDGLLLRASGGVVDKIQFSSSDNIALGLRPKLTITYACECGVVCIPPAALSCDADYIPTTKLSQFSPTAIGSDFIRGMSYLPEGGVFKGQAVPAGGSWLTVDSEKEMFFVDLNGLSMDTCSLPGGPSLWTDGITFITSGQKANSFAVVYNGTSNNFISYFDLDCNALGSFSTDSFGAAIPSGISHIGVTASSTYDDYLAVADGGNTPTVHIVDQNGIEAFALDVSAVVTELHGVVHVPGTDKLLLVDSPSSKVHVIDFVNFSGTSLAEYSSNSFGVNEPEGIAINTTTCDHAVGAQVSDSVAILNQVTGLLAHWKLDETGGLVAVDTDGGHNGDLLNGPTWTFTGQVGGALSFDGIDDYVDVPHNDALSLTSAFTISAWVRNESPFIANSYRILSKESVGANDSYWLSFQNTQLWFGVGGSFFSPMVAFDPDRWYHIAASFDDTADQIVMYIDGIEVLNQSTTASISPNTEPVLIGSNWEGFKLWDGLLDDIRIYNRALDASEVVDISSGGGGGDGAPTLSVLFVVGDPDSLTTRDAGRISLMESWGYGVNIIDDGDSASIFDGAIADASVLYVGTSTSASVVAGKVEDQAIGIVNENALMLDNFGFSLGGQFETHDQLEIIDASHYIMSDYAGTPVTILSDPRSLTALSGSVAPDLLSLAGAPVNGPDPIIVAALEAGATDVNSRTAAGRRVNLPLTQVQTNEFTADGEKLMRRAIEWAAGIGGGAASCDGTYRDEFNAISYSGNDGTLMWATDWLEINESGSPASGDESIVAGAVRVRDNDGGGEGLEREANLSSSASAILTFDYDRAGLDNAADYVTVDVSSNGGSTWTELDRFEGPGTDTAAQTVSYDISAYIASNTRIRFLSSPDLGAQDAIYFDNVEICVSN